MEQITTYLDSNSLIHKHQYGFKKNHSTEYAALHIVNYRNYEIDRNRTLTNVYLDLLKAFDCLLAGLSSTLNSMQKSITIIKHTDMMKTSNR